MILNKASEQWANRPADERYWNLQDMQAAANEYRNTAVESTVNMKDLVVTAFGKGLEIRKGGTGDAGYFTHFSFGQMAGLTKCPAEFVRSLAPETAARVLNERLVQKGTDAQLLWNSSTRQIRAFTSDKYGRIWNSDLVQRVTGLQAQGWRNPPARPNGAGGVTRSATEADVLACSKYAGLAIKVGDTIAPAGLYLSEKDMFMFLVNEKNPIDGGNGRALYKGFMLWNSEVGDMSFGIMTFFYNTICGNHIVWDAENVEMLRVVHLGNKAVGRAFDALKVELTRYADTPASFYEAKIAKARTFEIAASKDEVVKALFNASISAKTILGQAFDTAEKHREDGGCAPTTAWGMVQGMTRVSQETPFADERVGIDRSAGKIMKLVPF